jgi:lipid-binding SYLF domain-containing protein
VIKVNYRTFSLKKEIKGGIRMKKNIYCVRLLFVTFTLLMSFIIVANYAEAKTANEINASVNAAMNRFYKQVDGAKEFMAQAKAVLVMPNVTKAGFFAGGQYGEGALRVGGKTTGYYNLIAGSYGFTFGAERIDILIAFMTEDALKGFQKVKGWEVGVDANVALIDVGGGKRLDTTTLRDPVVGFVFDAKGLMVDLSLKGAKFTRIKK